MALKRICYTAALLGCAVFYIAYGEWFSWVLLLAVAGLPWLSLLISLPAIWDFRVSPMGPEAVQREIPAEAWLLGSSAAPMPPFRGKLRLRRLITGESRRYKTGSGLPTDHCGGLEATVERARVCDYLGLFSFPVRCREKRTILVRPTPLAVEEIPDLHRYIARSWKPKFGGGYAENHELRLYRPGDSLNQVHWKLSAKTGQLILREPMEPQRGLILLTMDLNGTPEEIDRKFGRLLYLGRHLLGQEAAFEIRCLTAEGILSFPVAGEQELNRAIDALLCRGAAAAGSIRDQAIRASWHYHIGGEPDET